MTRTRRVRWECPRNLHPTVLGPRQPRRDDPVRYCERCYEKTGAVTERIAPTVIAQRARAGEKAAKKKARTAAARARARQAVTDRHTVDGVDLRREMRKLTRLAALGGPRGRLHTHPPHLVISARSREPRRVGSADIAFNRIIIATWPGPDRR